MKFNDAKFARLYYMQQVEAGYPGRLLHYVLEELRETRSVIDIGAGNGFFAIPLLEAGHSVTAVEPSPEMASIMSRQVPPGTAEKFTLVQSPWEEWKGPHHDASICIHSLYPMPDRRLAVIKMLESSSRRIVIIRNNSMMKTITGVVRIALDLPDSADLNVDLSSILHDNDVCFKVSEIIENRDAVINDPGQEAESIMLRANIPAGMRETVTELIINHCRHEKGKYIFPSVYCDNAYVF